ncbi:hypothetical protein GZ78_21880 [Endozoicomonas numazuensis]|uniref:Uncharacterized protein n=1 Tax=Endozoicomonas numazuensis TaxID=1137799 RepID=A0A081NDI2_9GAMM|nr:hypothetical protein GZ78_21880 [Endozoicomonas numazuensis]
MSLSLLGWAHGLIFLIDSGGFCFLAGDNLVQFQLDLIVECLNIFTAFSLIPVGDKNLEIAFFQCIAQPNAARRLTENSVRA